MLYMSCADIHLTQTKRIIVGSVAMSFEEIHHGCAALGADCWDWTKCNVYFIVQMLCVFKGYLLRAFLRDVCGFCPVLFPFGLMSMSAEGSEGLENYLMTCEWQHVHTFAWIDSTASLEVREIKCKPSTSRQGNSNQNTSRGVLSKAKNKESIYKQRLYERNLYLSKQGSPRASVCIEPMPCILASYRPICFQLASRIHISMVADAKFILMCCHMWIPLNAYDHKFTLPADT